MITKSTHPWVVVAVATLFAAATAFSEEARTWTSSKDGRQFRGALVQVEGDQITIKREADGAVFNLQKTDLVQADLDWIAQNAESSAVPDQVTDLSALIAGVPASTGTPAVGVLLVKDGVLFGTGVSGIRKTGEETLVERGDKWHLGSCTKSMTATLAATFVEEGAITWETTLEEVLGEDVDMLDAYKPVTLGLLLANRGGIQGDVPRSVYDDIEKTTRIEDLRERDIIQQRAAYAEAVLNLDPVSTPGTGYQYSNSGFIIAGAMLEKISGKPWEVLMEERIFEPLGMTDSGFGSPAREDKRETSQPWPHKDPKTPIPPGLGDDNYWVLGPAGTVHCSLKDMARYLAMHAKREVGPVLKKAETYTFLHEAVPQNENYARGWITTRTSWSNGPAISHDGSNTMNYCSVWVAPESQTAVAAFTNCAEKGRETCMAAIKLVVGEYVE